MSTVIKPKRTFTTTKVPTTADIAEGEIAINAVDGKIWIRDNADNIVLLGGLQDGSDLPTSDPAVVGELWNDGGTVKISGGP